MKKKLRILLILLILLLNISGCMNEESPRKVVNNYLEMYKNLDSTVLNQLEEHVKEEELTDEQKQVYKEILKRQYKTLNYEIESETYVDDTAYIKVKIDVYDLYKVQQQVTNYYQNNKEMFINENGEYDKSKLLDYKLNKMLNSEDRVSHEIEFIVKKDKTWVVEQLSQDDLAKIHGIYNY